MNNKNKDTKIKRKMQQLTKLINILVTKRMREGMVLLLEKRSLPRLNNSLLGIKVGKFSMLNKKIVKTISLQRGSLPIRLKKLKVFQNAEYKKVKLL